MCNGIAVLVYEKEGELHGLCTGISSHDELCKEVEELRYGKIEPYRFELLYPCNLIFDRMHDFKGALGINKEQPDKSIWDMAFAVSKEFFMTHAPDQLTFAYLSGANLTYTDLTHTDLRGANLTCADLRGATLTYTGLTRANLTDADLTYTNLTGTNLTGADLTRANFKDSKFEATKEMI